MTPTDAELDAQDAYRAYGDVTGWQNFQGDPMPSWENLTPKIRTAWTAAVIRAQDNARRRDAGHARPR